MKTKNQTTTKALLGADKARQGRKPRFDEPSVPLFPATTNRGLIQWPTEKRIMQVSRQLVKIGQMGLRSEANGDYFTSGDLAYQLQQIIQETAELFKKSQRLKH